MFEYTDLHRQILLLEEGEVKERLGQTVDETYW